VLFQLRDIQADENHFSITVEALAGYSFLSHFASQHIKASEGGFEGYPRERDSDFRLPSLSAWPPTIFVLDECRLLRRTILFLGQTG